MSIPLLMVEFLYCVLWFVAVPLLPKMRKTLGLTKVNLWSSSIAGIAGTIILCFVLDPLCSNNTTSCRLIGNSWEKEKENSPLHCNGECSFLIFQKNFAYKDLELEAAATKAWRIVCVIPAIVAAGSEIITYSISDDAPRVTTLKWIKIARSLCHYLFQICSP